MRHIYPPFTRKGNGYLTMAIDGWSFWKLIDDPDAYQNDFFEDGDIYRPWP